MKKESNFTETQQKGLIELIDWTIEMNEKYVYNGEGKVDPLRLVAVAKWRMYLETKDIIIMPIFKSMLPLDPILYKIAKDKFIEYINNGKTKSNKPNKS